MEELIQNKEFLESVLSTLPGVNPEQALRNLREMTEASSAQAQGEGTREDEEEAMEEEKTESKVRPLLVFVDVEQNEWEPKSGHFIANCRNQLSCIQAQSL